MADREMHVTASSTDGGVTLGYETASGRSEVYVRSKDIRLTPNSEACVTSGLLPCMVTGSDLVLQGPISERFLHSLDTIRILYRQWYPYLRAVNVRGATPATRDANRDGRVAILFSAGVDSFYTLLERRNEITDLVFVRGFEYPAEEGALLDRMAEPVHRTAERLGMGVIELETNLRPFLLSHGLRWGLHGGGATKATLGQMLYPHFKRIYYGAGCTYAELIPWGSHPVLDPMWSTEGLEFVHHGVDANRIEKLRVLAQHDWILDSLRCCNERPTRALNCGRCEKCMRTMLNLLIVGALDRCQTFETGLDARRLSTIRLHTGHIVALMRQNIAALEQGGHPKEYVRALKTALRRSRREAAFRELMESTFPAVMSGLRKLRNLGRPASRRGGENTMQVAG